MMEIIAVVCQFVALTILFILLTRMVPRKEKELQDMADYHWKEYQKSKRVLDEIESIRKDLEKLKQ